MAKEIDFGKLEAELKAAEEADNRYQRENDAKFRALHQKVATYDEFRQIVLASHLKALDKTDKIDSTFKQQWNCPATSNNSSSVAPSVANEKVEMIRPPRTSHEFLRAWKRQCKTSAEKYKLLLQIASSSCTELVYAEICSGGLLGDILAVLSDEFQDADVNAAIMILDNLSCIEKFRLSLAFMTTLESQKCSKLLAKMDETLLMTCDDSLSDMKTKFAAAKQKYETA